MAVRDKIGLAIMISPLLVGVIMILTGFVLFLRLAFGGSI